jgi:glycosyltransferase involved in cell wall biosynthesis
MLKEKILLVSHGADFHGGAEFVFAETVSALSASDDVVAVFPEPGPLAQDAAEKGAQTYVLTIPRWGVFHYPQVELRARDRVRLTLEILAATAKAIRFLRKHRPSVVMTNTMAIPSFAVAARLTRIKHVWMIHEYGARAHAVSLLLPYRLTLRLVDTLSDVVICPSRAVEERLRLVVPRMRTRVVYQAVVGDSAPYRPRQSGRLRATLLGRFSDGKGQHLAIDALARARSKGADVRLTLVGGAYAAEMDAMERTAADAGCSPYVDVKPFTSSPAKVWADADVALMCSREEAFGRVTVEAMRASLPVLGANDGGTREIVVDDLNGFLFPPDDSEALSNQLVTLCGDEELRRRLAHGAAQTASRFNLGEYSRGLRAALFPERPTGP